MKTKRASASSATTLIRLENTSRPTENLRTVTSFDGKVFTIVLIGHVSMMTFEAFRNATFPNPTKRARRLKWLQAIAIHPIVIDMSLVLSLESAGAGIIRDLAQKVRQDPNLKGFEIRDPSLPVTQTLELTGLVKVVTITTAKPPLGIQ